MEPPSGNGQLLGLIAPGAKCRPMDIFGVVQSRFVPFVNGR